MTTPNRPPERQSRARAGLAADGSGPVRATPPSGPPNGATPASARPGGELALDLDRLRASAASAVDAEQAASRSGAPAAATAALRPAGDTSEPTGGAPGWLRVALPIGVVIALATVGITVVGGGSDDAAAPPASTTPAETLPKPTTAPLEARPTTLPPTSAAAPTTDAPATTAPTPPVQPSGPPPHKATYRDGKLYLEGRITSAEESQKYVDKAAAVLGPDNVVNNYVIDPTVPVSTDGTVYVDEPFLFETGSSELNPAYTGVLGLGIAALRLNPGARMVVTGYTDSQGDPAKNQELSQQRAQTVVDYMVTTGGLDRGRFDAIGAGDQDPVGDNNTPEGRRLNRRIDVKLVNLLG